MGLKRKSQNKIYENYWEHIEHLAKDEATNNSRVSDFIRDYLTLENKKIPNKNKVYQEFKEKYPTSTVASLEENLIPIKKLVKYFNKLINLHIRLAHLDPNHPYRQTNHPFSSFSQLVDLDQ